MNDIGIRMGKYIFKFKDINSLDEQPPSWLKESGVFGHEIEMEQFNVFVRFKSPKAGNCYLVIEDINSGVYGEIVKHLT